MWNYDNPGEIIFTAVAIVISLTIHEYSHAIISTVQGDDTPGKYGRLSLNPLDHIDIIGLISLFVFGFGWAKPVPIRSKYYKNPRLGIILTSIAGPVSNLLLAFFSMVVIYAINIQSLGIKYFLGTMVSLNIGLAVFNLIPIPPLDGSKVIAEIFGGRVAEFIYRVDRIGMVVLLLLLWIPPVSEILFKAIYYVAYVMETFVQIFF